MTETLFYHLERRALEAMLPGLVEKSLEQAAESAPWCKNESSERGSDALDTLLWTYDDQELSWPHAQPGDG